MTGARDEFGGKGNKCMGIVEDRHALDPTLGVAGCVNRLYKRRSLAGVECDARPDHSHTFVAEAGEVTEPVKLWKRSLSVDDNGRDVLRVRKGEEAGFFPKMPPNVFVNHLGAAILQLVTNAED